MDQNMDQKIEATYPTIPDADGFYYENEVEFGLDILTKSYENGNMVKKSLLPRCGKTAIVRELLGKDNDIIRNYMGEVESLYQYAAITTATLFDGGKLAIDEVRSLKLKDFNRLLIMHQALNF